MNKKRLLELNKLSGTTSTQPLYETEDGREFTVSDIVQGKIKPPKKYKSKSLSYRYRVHNKKASARRFDKKAYKSGDNPDPIPVKNMPPINIPGAPEPYFGIIPNDFSSMGTENEEYFLGSEARDFVIGDDSFDLTNYLIDLSNKLDSRNNVKMSNFVDFLIKKGGQLQDVDYSDAFNELIIKINESDIEMKNHFIKKIANKFSRLVMIGISNGDEEYDAKMYAYKKCLLLVESHMV